jgi:hypothetical protein
LALPLASPLTTASRSASLALADSAESRLPLMAGSSWKRGTYKAKPERAEWLPS